MISLLPRSARAFAAESERFGAGSAAHGTMLTEPLTLGAARAAESRRFARVSPFQRRFSAQTATLDGEAVGTGWGGAA